MEFTLVEREGVPDKMMDRFYSMGDKSGNFGTTKARAESGKYDTVVLVSQGMVAGTADLRPNGSEALLEGCYILPEYRGKLELGGKSAFEHMAGVRLNRAERPARTSATTDHGVTQHVYNKFDFAPYEFELPKNPQEKPHITMAEPHEKRRFDRELYAPEAVREFIQHVASGFGQEAELNQGEYAGVEVSYIEDVFAEDYEFFKLSEGDQELQPTINDIADEKSGSTNITAQIDPEMSSSYDIIKELLKEDFRPSGYKPFIEGSRLTKSSGFNMSYSNEPMNAELIPETKQLLEAGGWGVQMIERQDKSSEFKIF